MPHESARVSATIDLQALSHNIGVLKELPENRNASLCAVLKADGYGHGAVALAKVLETDERISAYAVATASEAIQLRTEANALKPVMILGYAFPESDEALFLHDIQPSVFREDSIRSIEDCAKKLQKEKRQGAVSRLRVHVPVDTGMGRIGVTPDDNGIAFVKRVLESDAMTLEGLFTHFATADEADDTFTTEQCERFAHFCDRVREELHAEVPCIHADNSAAMMLSRGRGFTMTRAGIAMYGIAPSGETAAGCPSSDMLKPILSWHSHLSLVKDVPAGTPISYGRTFVTKRPSRIATVPVGYADGYPRSLSNAGEVLIRGKRAKVAGRVCMDQFMVDVTDIPEAEAGDTVTLIGTDGKERITAADLGEISGRFHYELLCCINKRVPRIYYA